MFDATLIETCADPSLTPAIVEQFVEAVGSPDPLAITVKSGGRLILVPKPQAPQEAISIISDNVSRAVVRVGLTQFPAGVGVKDASELSPDLVDACGNLRMGTKMFAKIMRIVAKWYGNPTAKDVLPQIFEDAVYAWQTGKFEGVNVFQAEDPGPALRFPNDATSAERTQERTAEAIDQRDGKTEKGEPPEEISPETDPGKAGIRIGMSRVWRCGPPKCE